MAGRGRLPGYLAEGSEVINNPCLYDSCRIAYFSFHGKCLKQIIICCHRIFLKNTPVALRFSSLLLNLITQDGYRPAVIIINCVGAEIFNTKRNTVWLIIRVIQVTSQKTVKKHLKQAGKVARAAAVVLKTIGKKRPRLVKKAAAPVVAAAEWFDMTCCTADA